MFGSTNPFGQSSNSPFGSQPLFGQSSSSGTNPFAPKPFGSPNSFGSQTGGSIFGGTSTSVFGQTPSPFASQPTFGASSAFGATSTSTSPFGGSSGFGQKPAFGGFGSTPSQASPFGSTFQQTQSASGSNLFGSNPFGASSQPTFGASSTPAFGATSAPAFGATTTPTFGATTTTPAFGATTTAGFGSTTTPAFGSTTTPLFGSTGTGFGVSSISSFGSSVTPAFGAPSTSLFGSSSAPAFGASTTQAFGSSTAPTFGSSTFGFGSGSGSGSTPSFSQSASTFGSTPFGTAPSPFGTQSSQFGAQTTTPAFGSPGFGQSAFGGQQGGSRVASYTPTPEADGSSGTQPAGKLESISAMPVYKDKSHEELRWEDYQRGDKGGPNPSGQPAVGIGFPPVPTQTGAFVSPGTSGQTAVNPFASPPSNPFGPKTSTFGPSNFGPTATSVFNLPFGSTSPSPFVSTSTTPFASASTTSFGFNASPSIYNGGTNSATSTPFGPGLTGGGTQSSGLFQSTPAIGQTPSLFGQPSTGFQQAAPSVGSTLFNNPMGGLLNTSTPSSLPTSNLGGFGQANPSLSTAYPMTTPIQTSSAFPFSSFGQTQPGGFGSISNTFNQGSLVQPAATQANMVVQPSPITNPFGTLPAMPQMSIGCVGSSQSVQYGISSMPVAEKPNPVRISSLLTPRHLSQRRIWLPARRYHPKSNGPMVPFYTDDEEAPTTPKADALFIQRENPRALIIRPIEQWPSANTREKQSMLKEIHPAIENESPAENGHKEQNNAPPTLSEPTEKPNGFHVDHTQKGTDSSYITISGHRAGEAAIVYEHGADIEALMPKLRHTDYYTEPLIQELAAKERGEPGFCRHVRDFVVGRQGFGSIKFFGETDVRRLDLESIVQFNNREVIVYRDESKKPLVGQGLNKPAEVTLLNIKCMNRKTGQQYTEGPKVEKYKEMLMKKAEEQGAEFVSYDPLKGEWRFKVKHFSRYGSEIEDWDTDDSCCDETRHGGSHAPDSDKSGGGGSAVV